MKNWNADEWHLFLCQHLDNRATSPNGLNKIALAIVDEIDERVTQANALATVLDALANAEALNGVRKIVAGWNGDGREGAPFKRHPDNLGATIPKTRCKAIYDLDEAIERAKTMLIPAETKRPRP